MLLPGRWACWVQLHACGAAWCTLKWPPRASLARQREGQQAHGSAAHAPPMHGSSGDLALAPTRQQTYPRSTAAEPTWQHKGQQVHATMEQANAPLHQRVGQHRRRTD